MPPTSSEPPARRILLLTDRPDRSRDLAQILVAGGSLHVLRAGQSYDPSLGAPLVIFCDVDLRDSRSVRATSNELARKVYQGVRRFFVVDEGRYHAAVQAASLGATDTVTRPLAPETVLSRLRSIFSRAFDTEIVATGGALGVGLAGANVVLTKMFEGLPAGNPFAVDDVFQEEVRILHAVRSAKLDGWLDTVWRHHSQSYKHCFSVTGFATAFAQHLGMRETDQRRVARAALIHDVGKAFIPLTVLDKPGKLTDVELDVMRRHSRLGHDALVRQGGFPDDAMDVVLNHHEMLDGSGYPNGIGGSQISDIVRMITITDIFSALIEVRSYKASVSRPRAYEIMQSMAGKLDTALLAAFRPVALGA